MTRDEVLETLGLDAEADHEEIRHQYRCLCLQLHPDRFSSPAEKTRAAGAFLRVRDAYEFFKKNRSLFRAAQAAPQRHASGRREEWDVEMEALLRRRPPPSKETGLRAAASDWWQGLGEEKVRTIVTLLLAALVLVPAWAVLLSGFGGTLLRSLTPGDAVFSALFLLACLTFARGLRSGRRP